MSEIATPAPKDHAGVLERLSYRLFAVAAAAVGIGLIIGGLALPGLGMAGTVLSATGASVLAAVIVQHLYDRVAKEYFATKVAAESATAAIAYAQELFRDQFRNVVPQRAYPRTSEPLDDFRRDFTQLLRESKFYRHKGDAASFAGFRLTRLASHQALMNKEAITLCIIDPREDRLVRQHAHHKLSVAGSRYSKDDIERRSMEIREEVFITLVAIFDIAHLVRIEVIFHRESLFFRSELFENGLFVSYYLGGDYPGTYLYARGTHVFEAFMRNFQQVCSASDYRLTFSADSTEQDFALVLERLGCRDDLASLRKKRDSKYQEYLRSLPFEPNELF